MAFDVICKLIGFLNAWQLHSPRFAASILDKMSLISHPQWTFTDMFAHLTVKEQGQVYFIPDKGHQWEMSTRHQSHTQSVIFLP